MALPLDVTKLTVLCGGPPQAVLDRDTGEHRRDRDGRLLYRTDVIAIGSGRPDLLGVRTPNEPKGLTLGSRIAVNGLTISTFTAKDGGTGVFYEALAIETAKPGGGGS